jgi:ATP-binding cassette subfamily G (WHITE) protein 2 (PDR)
MINEFSGRQFECVSFVPAGPAYTGLGAAQTVCSAVGAVAGSTTVDGETYINIAYDYYRGHKWRWASIYIQSFYGSPKLTSCLSETSA